MTGRIGGAVAGLVLALGLVGPAAAQDCRGRRYGNYGYGTGFENSRNPYGYPRPTYAEGPSIPNDDTALYGGYMPVAYYTGAGYARDNATVFLPVGLLPGGRSCLYCADIQSGSGQLMSSATQTSTRQFPIGRSWAPATTAATPDSEHAHRRWPGPTPGTLQAPTVRRSTSTDPGTPNRTTTSLSCR